MLHVLPISKVYKITTLTLYSFKHLAQVINKIIVL